MKSPILGIAFTLATLGAFGSTNGFGASDTTATVRRVLGKASSKPDATLAEGEKFSTAARSKAELASGRGIVRVGEKAELDMARSGGIAVRQGITLVASNPGTFRKTIEVRAPGYRARVRGTAQIAYEPGRSLKVVVLEGSVTVSLDSLTGEFETLTPGQQLIINPSDRRLPQPVEIDLGRLVATSQMVGGEFGPLATQPLIDASISGQGEVLLKGDLSHTPFYLAGTETELRARELLRNGSESRPKVVAADPGTVEQSIFRLVNDLDNPRAVTKAQPYTFNFSGVSLTPLDTFIFQRNELNKSRTHELRVGLPNNGIPEDPFVGDPGSPATQPPRIVGTIRVDPDIFSGARKALVFTANVTLADAPFERLSIEPTADIETPPGVALKFDNLLGIDIDGARLQAGTGSRISELLSIKSATGDIRIKNGATLTGGTIALAGAGSAVQPQTIEINTGAKLTSRYGQSIGNGADKTGILIQNSSELASLLDNLDLLSAGGPITVDSAKLYARKKLTIDASPNAATLVTFRNVEAMAATIRARAFSPSGDALIIDGSTFNASQLIRLYAEGASTLRFRNNVTLTTPRAELAGKTVEVDPGGAVTISGRGTVFSDQANFNTGGFGTIQAAKGLKEQPFAKRPKF